MSKLSCKVHKIDKMLASTSTFSHVMCSAKFSQFRFKKKQSKNQKFLKCNRKFLVARPGIDIYDYLQKQNITSETDYVCVYYECSNELISFMTKPSLNDLELLKKKTF